MNEISEEEVGDPGYADAGEQKKNMVKINKQLLNERSTMPTHDTNSNRKQNTDSKQRTNSNTSMQNLPRGLLNKAFSQISSASLEEVPPLPTNPQTIIKFYLQDLTDYEKGEVLDFDTIYFLGKDKKQKASPSAEQTLPLMPPPK